MVTNKINNSFSRLECSVLFFFSLNISIKPVVVSILPDIVLRNRNKVIPSKAMEKMVQQGAGPKTYLK